VLALALSSSAARAQPAPPAEAPRDPALAETLFQRGKALMLAGRHREACPLFEESQRLEPGSGTLLALALCHEGEGKTATAWVELRAALAAAEKDGRADRAAFVRQRLSELEPRLVRMVVEVPPPVAARPGLRVSRNGVPLGPAAWGVAAPVDPGEHRIEATAEGAAPWARTVVAEARGGELRVTVGPLESPRPPLAEAARGPTAVQVGGIVAGSAGLIAIGVGGYFGLRAIDKSGEAEDRCSTERCTDPEGVRLSEEAIDAANVANVTIGVGLAAVAAGVLMIVLGGEGDSDAAAAVLRPAPGGVALRFR
jgi:tetratricopeptide (TPR) repeat protein